MYLLCFVVVIKSHFSILAWEDVDYNSYVLYVREFVTSLLNVASQVCSC